MRFREIEGPQQLPDYLRDFVNCGDGPVEYDFGWVAVMLAALLDNLKRNAIESELEDIGDRLSDDQRRLLAKLAQYATRITGSEVDLQT